MPVIIKRYANRKLYNTKTRAYVTLDDIGWMIQQGEDVTILDHESGNDITAVTLTQVIFDQEKRRGGLLPQTFFSGLIKASTRGLTSFYKGVDSFLEPGVYFTAELQRRLDLLQQEKRITPEEYQHLSNLLLDERFESREEEIENVSTEQLQTLMQQLETLESELAQLKQKKQKNEQEE
jgi:polyhydroxyalkanoate synthesis repressor PhaR